MPQILVHPFGGQPVSVDVVPSRMGVALPGDWYPITPSVLAERFDRMRANGVRWIRFVINWGIVQQGGPSSFSWAGHDNVVNAARAAGMRLLLIPGSCPNWAATGGASGWTAPASPAAYATFCGQVVGRYSPLGVRHYEVWNEPNIAAFWSNGPDAAAYSALLKAAAPAIRAADPGAFIVSAGLSPATDTAPNISPTTFLSAMYAAGCKGHFDAVGWHPYATGILPSTYQSWSTWSKMDETPTSARSIMSANGDAALTIWATEYGQPTGGPPTFVTEDFQAEALTDAYAYMRRSSWMGPVFWFTYTDRVGTDRSSHQGLIRADGTAKPSLGAYAAAAVA